MLGNEHTGVEGRKGRKEVCRPMFRVAEHRPAKQLAAFPVPFIRLTEGPLVTRYVLIFDRPSFNRRLIKITTGLDYHITKGNVNGNGSAVAHQECKSLECI